MWANVQWGGQRGRERVIYVCDGQMIR